VGEGKLVACRARAARSCGQTEPALRVTLRKGTGRTARLDQAASLHYAAQCGLCPF